MGTVPLVAVFVSASGLGQSPKVPRRVAILTVSGEASFASSLKAVREGLSESGLVEGQDIAIDVRYGNGRTEDLSRLAAELTGLRPAVIIALGASATDAALATSGDVPIVSLGDLVARGHASQLGRPGSRVTGISFLPTPLNVKRLELLAELLPKRSGVLNLADLRPIPGAMQVVEDAGRSLGLVTHAAYANTPAEIELAFQAARKLRVAGVNVFNSPFLSAESARIIRSRPRPDCPPSNSGRRPPAKAA